MLKTVLAFIVGPTWSSSWRSCLGQAPASHPGLSELRSLSWFYCSGCGLPCAVKGGGSGLDLVGLHGDGPESVRRLPVSTSAMVAHRLAQAALLCWWRSSLRPSRSAPTAATSATGASRAGARDASRTSSTCPNRLIQCDRQSSRRRPARRRRRRHRQDNDRQRCRGRSLPRRSAETKVNDNEGSHQNSQHHEAGAKDTPDQLVGLGLNRTCAIRLSYEDQRRVHEVG